MQDAMPQPIQTFFNSDKTNDTCALDTCFWKDAVVKDEGHTYSGLAAIKKWRDDGKRKYQYSCEPFNIQPQDGKIVVTSHLVGSFPGSPLDLRYFFELEGDKIAALEIIL